MEREVKLDLKKSKRIFTLIAISLALLILTLSSSSKVSASGTVPLDSDLNIDDSIDLQPITIPFFPQLALPGTEYDTIWSWISFFGALFTLGMLAFWIFLILKAGLNVYQKQGQPEGIQESMQRLKSVFIGAGLSMIIPIFFVVVGAILGLGAPWRWPAALRSCPNSAPQPGTVSATNPEGSKQYDFYFQAVLDAPTGHPNPQEWANGECFGSSTEPNT